MIYEDINITCYVTGACVNLYWVWVGVMDVNVFARGWKQI
jgi:hypothetical protein